MDVLVWLFGIGAMASLFISYQQRTRGGLLAAKLSADAFWVAHYFCLGATAGMIPNLVGIFRELVFINRHRKWANRKIWVVFFIAMNIMLCISTFKNYYDVIPIIASSFVTISLWINNPDLTKKISAPVSLSFLIYDIFVHSYMGIINESLSVISIIIYFTRKFKEKKQ
jgi:hypothetical protein